MYGISSPLVTSDQLATPADTARAGACGTHTHTQGYIFLAIGYAQETIAADRHDSSEEADAILKLESEAGLWAAWRSARKSESEATEACGGAGPPGGAGAGGGGGAVENHHVHGRNVHKKDGGSHAAGSGSVNESEACPFWKETARAGCDWIAEERAKRGAGAGRSSPVSPGGGALENMFSLLHKFAALALVLLALASPAAILLRVVAYSLLGEHSQLPLSLVLGNGVCISSREGGKGVGRRKDVQGLDELAGVAGEEARATPAIARR